jgi:hypothetical protein
MDPAQAFLLDQIPVPQRAVIPTTLKSAYDAFKQLVKDEPILNVESARQNWGRFIQFSVDLAFERLVESGRWGQGCTWKSFSKPTGRFLEVAFSHSTLTISQVADPTKQPRDVGFRENLRTRSQMCMEFIKDDEPPSGPIHILLLHGHQELTFAHLAIPEPEIRRGFQTRTGNLLAMPHEVTQPEPAMEDTDFELVMQIKTEIDRWRRDNEIE